MKLYKSLNNNTSYSNYAVILTSFCSIFNPFFFVILLIYFNFLELFTIILWIYIYKNKKCPVLWYFLQIKSFFSLLKKNNISVMR